ncbi:hypothetical protein [Pseudalkalibacillus caeni]|uniref:Lipoprotein n=1 Tax=Exobacillus caeni TaxID=2574798 RepID=A0A5R9F1U1_9BACL|nr:hypothetical protein [Pseudalkalibacillus caeni]TLS36420.1 hypothetical protein FCL54_15960 [Pseudalkalibacillus caeni]
MKKQYLFLFFGLIFLLVSCENPRPLDETLSSIKGYNGSHVLVPVKEGAILIYTVKPENADGTAIGSGFLKGSKEEGWIRADGGFGWDMYGNANLMTAENRLLVHKSDNPDDEKTVSLSYGLVENPYITNIFLKEGNDWIEAEYIPEKRIYYKIGDFTGIKGTSKNGTVIDIQGTGDFEMQQLIDKQVLGERFLQEIEWLRGYEYHFLGATEHTMTKEDWEHTGKPAGLDIPSNVTKLEYIFPVTPQELTTKNQSEESRVTLFLINRNNVVGYISAKNGIKALQQ